MTQPTPFKQLLDIIYGGSPSICKNIQTLKSLIPQVDPNKKEELIADGCLTYLARNKRIPDDVVQNLLHLLIKKGADKNYCDNTGNILHGFIRADRYELFTEFVKAGVEINAKTTTGMGSTPLHAAVEKNKSAFVEYLLSCEKIDPTILDNNQKTAKALITEQTDKAIKDAFDDWETRQKDHKAQQATQTYRFFPTSNAISTSREYSVSKTLVKRRQQQGYQLVSQDDEDKNELPKEHDGNTQSSWLSHFISKLAS